MKQANVMPQTALKYDYKVIEEGLFQLHVPFYRGTRRVQVFVLQEPADTFDELLQASQSSQDFWHNPFMALKILEVLMIYDQIIEKSNYEITSPTEHQRGTRSKGL